MSRAGRAGLLVLVVLVVFLIATVLATQRTGAARIDRLSKQLAAVQASNDRKDGQLEQQQRTIESQSARLDSAAQQRGELVGIVAVLSRQLRNAGLTPAAMLPLAPTQPPASGPQPSSGASPDPEPVPRPSQRPAARPTPRPAPQPTPSPTPGLRVCAPLIGCLP